MKKSIFLFAITTCIALSCILGCSNKEPKEGVITIYGTITDQIGSPIPGVSVSVSPYMDRSGNTRLICSGSKIVTSSDGMYETPLYCAFETESYDRYQTDDPIQLLVLASKAGHLNTSRSISISPSMLNQKVQVSLVLR